MGLKGNYEFFRQRLSWDQAQNSCVEKGGNLASILSEEDQRDLLEATQGYSSYFWVGGRKLTAEENSYRWTDGSPWRDYNNFSPYYSPYYAYRCLYISREWWYIYSCTYNMPYVCQFSSLEPSRDLYLLSSFNLTRDIDFSMDVTHDSLVGVEVPGFKVGLRCCSTNSYNAISQAIIHSYDLNSRSIKTFYN